MKITFRIFQKTESFGNQVQQIVTLPAIIQRKGRVSLFPAWGPF